MKAKRIDNMWCKSACSLLRVAQEDMVDLLEAYPSLHDRLRALHCDRRSDRRRAQRKSGCGAVPALPSPTGGGGIPAGRMSDVSGDNAAKQLQAPRQLQVRQQPVQALLHEACSGSPPCDDDHSLQLSKARGVKVRCTC